MKKQTVIFLGTPEFGAIVLEQLIKADYEILLVLTAAKQKVGRKQLLGISPVNIVAEKYHLPCEQPVKIADCAQMIEKLQPDFLITAAYGQIIPNEILAIPKYPPLNVHGSILPKYRGGAPIQRALMANDKVLGVSIIEMVAKMDAGPVYEIAKIPVSKEDNFSSMFIKLAHLGAATLIDVLPRIANNTITPAPQDEALVTYAANLTKADELIDLEQSSEKVMAQIRGLSDIPGGYILLDNNKRCKIFKVVASTLASGDEKNKLVVKEDKLYLVTKDYLLQVLELQHEGKKRMSGKDFINGGLHVI